MILTNPKVVEAMSKAENKRAAAEMKKTPSDGSPTFPERLEKAFTVIGCPDTFDEIMEYAEKKFSGSPEPLADYLLCLIDKMYRNWREGYPDLKNCSFKTGSTAPTIQNIFKSGYISSIDSFINCMSALNFEYGVFDNQSWQRLTAFSKLLFRRDKDESYIALYPRDTDDLAVYVLIRTYSPATYSIENKDKTNLRKQLQEKFRNARIDAVIRKDMEIIEKIKSEVLAPETFWAGLKKSIGRYIDEQNLTETVLSDCKHFLNNSLRLETARNTEGHNPKGRGKPASDIVVSGLFAARDTKPEAGYLDRLWREAAILLCGSTEFSVPDNVPLLPYLERQIDHTDSVNAQIWERHENWKKKEWQETEIMGTRRAPDLLERVLTMVEKRLPENTYEQNVLINLSRGIAQYMLIQFYLPSLRIINKSCLYITKDTSGVTGGVRTDIDSQIMQDAEPIEAVCEYIREHIEKFYGKRHRTLLNQVLLLSLDVLRFKDIDCLDDDTGEMLGALFNEAWEHFFLFKKASPDYESEDNGWEYEDPGNNADEILDFYINDIDASLSNLVNGTESDETKTKPITEKLRVETQPSGKTYARQLNSVLPSRDIQKVVAAITLGEALNELSAFGSSKTGGFNPFRLPCMLSEPVDNADESKEESSPLVILRSILIILTIETEIAAFSHSNQMRITADIIHRHIDNVLMSCGLAPLYDLPDLASEPGASEAAKFDYYISQSLQSVAKLAVREKNPPSQEEWQNE